MKKRVALFTAVLFACVFNLGYADDLETAFASAPPEFSPVPIWWWSGDPVERDRIKEQLTRMVEGGIHNAIILNLAPSGPLYGSAPDEPPFLTEAWWDLLAYTLEVGKEVGVRIWFYDQLGFSGAGLQARVVRDNPQFRGIDLNRIVKNADGPTDVTLQTPVGSESLAAFISERVVEERSEKDLQAKWIWSAAHKNAEVKLYFRRTFNLESVPSSAKLSITCDNGYVLYVNGQKIGEESTYAESGWQNAETFDVTSLLQSGTNVIAAVGENLGGEAGLLISLTDGENKPIVVSDASFRIDEIAPGGWNSPAFDDGNWKAADELGAPPMAPWGLIGGFSSAVDVNDFGVKVRNVRNLTSSIENGRIQINVPAGPHRISLFYTTPGGFDYQNPEAGKALLQLVHGEMEKRFGNELGKTIAGSFQDEFPALPHYSKRMRDEFRNRKGYDLIECLPALYDDVIAAPDRSTTVQIRCDADDVAAALCEEAFFIPLYEWHQKHGMLCGYDQTVRNADPNAGERYYVDYFKTMRHYSVPGNDMDGDCKPHQSIADLYGRPRVWAEVFHSSGWGQTVEEINTLLNPWLVNGATLFNPHAIYYSIHGSYWEWAPPDTGWRQPYFKYYNRFSDHVSRLTYMLSQGKHTVRIGVLHPANTVHGYRGFGSGSYLAQRCSELYWAAQTALRNECIDYIILDEDSVQRATVNDGQLGIDGIDIRLAILPETPILHGKTLQILTQFVERGGTCVIVGDSPRHASDRTLSPDEFTRLVSVLKDKAVKLKTADGLAAEVLKVVPKEIRETLPALRRKIGGRDFFFVLSDNGTPQNGRARFDINQRKLWETDAGQGKRIPITLGADGVPERWDSLTGKIVPIHNYIRKDGRTTVAVDLTDTPAPLISIRPAKVGEPLAVESDLQILDWTLSGIDAATVHGVQRIAPPETNGATHYARIEYPKRVFTGETPVAEPVTIDIPGPLSCRLLPTCYNNRGDFDWPPFDSPIPIEVRAARYHSEKGAEESEIDAWKSPDFDDTPWPTVIASFGPRAHWAGPLTPETGKTFETLDKPFDFGEPGRQAVYSLKLGIDEDPVFRSALGGKGRIPEDFIDLGSVKAGEIYQVSAAITLPGTETVDALLRLGGSSKRRVFLNGEEVQFEGAASAGKARAPVRLNAGVNRLQILVSRETAGPIRLFYHFLPTGGVPGDPEWIWSAGPGADGQSRFIKRITIPTDIENAEMIVALGDLHQIRINGTLVADQGNFDPYFTSRAECYSITRFLQTGENLIEIIARDTGNETGLLLDGLITLKDGQTISFVSDASFSDESERAAKIIQGPAISYMGDPALMLLQTRPHPLPFAGWLAGQEPPAPPFDSLVFGTGIEPEYAGWYRFRVPPGSAVIAFKSAGDATLYLDGESLELKESNGYFFADLPNHDSPKRIAALRIEPVSGFEEGAALLEPILFIIDNGKIPFGSWDELGLPHYCGGMVYETDLEIPVAPSTRYVVDLGHVRGVVETIVNGQSCGVRLWHPYRFDVTDAAREGNNKIEFHVYNTLGPHFDVGHPGGHVYANHTKSGIFGPVKLYGLDEVTIQLKLQE